MISSRSNNMIKGSFNTSTRSSCNKLLLPPGYIREHFGMNPSLFPKEGLELIHFFFQGMPTSGKDNPINNFPIVYPCYASEKKQEGLILESCLTSGNLKIFYEKLDLDALYTNLFLHRICSPIFRYGKKKIPEKTRLNAISEIKKKYPNDIVEVRTKEFGNKKLFELLSDYPAWPEGAFFLLSEFFIDPGQYHLLGIGYNWLNTNPPSRCPLFNVGYINRKLANLAFCAVIGQLTQHWIGYIREKGRKKVTEANVIQERRKDIPKLKYKSFCLTLDALSMYFCEICEDPSKQVGLDSFFSWRLHRNAFYRELKKLLELCIDVNDKGDILIILYERLADIHSQMSDFEKSKENYKKCFEFCTETSPHHIRIKKKIRTLSR